MLKTLRSRAGRGNRVSAVAAALGVLVLTAILVVGCGSTAAETPTTPAASSQAVAKASTPPATAASDVQTCLECGTKKMPAMVKGQAVVENGVQVVNVAIEGGTYVPNTISVKAGMPVRVVFTGKAKGCLAKPTFKSLGKSGDVTGSGSATIDLGPLQAGTFKFTCSMGMNAGTITAS